MKKKIVIFSGAGLDKESNIDTFRDIENGLWYNYDIEEVATKESWYNNKEKVLDFHNKLRRLLPTVEPNEAHKLIASLENDFDVVNITQNVSDLLERAGSSNVIHLHGELTKAIPNYLNGHQHINRDKVVNIGYNDINLGDKDSLYSTQLRPDVVWFGEYPYMVNEAYKEFKNADIIIIIGTSLQISYTFDFFTELKSDCKIYYIDPEPNKDIETVIVNNGIEYITEIASKGMKKIVNKL